MSSGTELACEESDLPIVSAFNAQVGTEEAALYSMISSGIGVKCKRTLDCPGILPSLGAHARMRLGQQIREARHDMRTTRKVRESSGLIPHDQPCGPLLESLSHFCRK